MHLIVGLGNPGREYAGSRHNIGFRVADLLAERWGVTTWRKKFSAESADVRPGGRPAVLLKPQTYMNRSGRSVAEALRFFRAALEELLIVSDDLDLPVGRLRLRAGGSSGGQRGLEDIIDALGSDQFARLRFGIGRPVHGSATDYVLERFTEVERPIVEASLPRAADAIECWMRDGISAAMNRFNRSDTNSE
jgi:PTH1 family peptidyl-tRNA hydrolase